LLQAEDGDSDDDDADAVSRGNRTTLECYKTPLDENDCVIDEYQIFKSVLESELLKCLCAFSYAKNNYFFINYITVDNILLHDDAIWCLNVTGNSMSNVLQQQRILNWIS